MQSDPPIALASAGGPRGPVALVGAGLRHLGLVLRGRAPGLGVARADFSSALIAALRVHFFPFPLAAALAGVASAPRVTEPWRVVVAVVAASLAWGVGQIPNDLADLDADALDAPDRPGVRGLLPVGPTMAVVLGLAGALTLALASVHPDAWLLVAACAILLAAYQPAKSVPGLGNLAHGALMATVVLLGRAAAEPGAALPAVIASAATHATWVGGVAALYLQSNYEKDARGDGRAGYRTLAALVGVRGSAAVRGLLGAGLALLGWRAGLATGPSARVAFGLGVVLLVASVIPPLLRGGRGAALLGYRLAVHATNAWLLVPAVPLLGPATAGAGFVLSGLLVERAFARTANP